MAPLGTAESTIGNINEDLQHYKKKLNESTPRALFPWSWPVPISKRRGFETGETSPSPLSPSRVLRCSALTAACRPQRQLWLSCCAAAPTAQTSPKCRPPQQLGPVLPVSHIPFPAGSSCIHRQSKKKTTQTPLSWQKGAIIGPQGSELQSARDMRQKGRIKRF